MSTTESFELAVRQVETLLTSFGRFADAGDGDALAALFLPDGELRAGQQVVSGREAIAAFTNRRSAQTQRKTRHTWSNLRVESTPDGMLRATSIQQTFEQHGTDSLAQCRISDLTDTFGRDDQEHWRFQVRQISRVFTIG